MKIMATAPHHKPRLEGRGPVHENRIKARDAGRGGRSVPAWMLGPQGVTGVAATDVLTAARYPLANGAKVRFSGLTGGAGLSAGTSYFVRDAAGLTFKVSATPGGAAVNLTSDLTAGSVAYA